MPLHLLCRDRQICEHGDQKWEQVWLIDAVWDCRSLNGELSFSGSIPCLCHGKPTHVKEKKKLFFFRCCYNMIFLWLHVLLFCTILNDNGICVTLKNWCFQISIFIPFEMWNYLFSLQKKWNWKKVRKERKALNEQLKHQTDHFL